MASINTIVKRKQYLWLGIVVVGTASAIGGALYLSDVDMSGNGETVAEQEPVPDMTGVVDTTFDDKVRQHATTEMQVTAAQMQKQYEEIRRELDVLNKQRGDDQRRIEKLGQDNAALAEQVKALGANPVTATGEPVPQMPASPPGPEGEPQLGNTPVSFPPQGSVAVPPPTAFYPGNGVTPPPQVTYQSVPVPIILYCLFIFFWILVGLVLWVKISWQTFVNGCIYWWCTTLEGMRDLIRSQPVYEIQYYGKTFRMNAAQVLHDKYMIWCGEQLWSAFVLASVVALVICLITFFVVSWILGRQGKQQSENEITGGRQLTDNPKEVARMLKKDGKDSDIRIGDLPIIRDSEIQNFCLHGTVGAGKSEVIRRLANYARQRGDMVVIYDRSGEFVKSYYDPSIDKILNPLDARCAAWDLWKECLTQPDFDNTANTLIPMGTKEDPFWQGSGRTIFAEAAYLMRNDPNRSYSKLVDTLLSIKIEKLRTFLRNSPAANLVEEKIEKTAISIRAVLTNYVKAIRYLQGIEHNGEPFTIRDWMRGVREDQKNGWLFISSNADTHASLKPVISMWLSIAIRGLLAMGENRNRRVWFFCDELPTLHKLPDLVEILPEARKFGGCYVFGIQSYAQLEDIYGEKAAATLFDVMNTRAFFRSPSHKIAEFAAGEIGEKEHLKASEQYSYGADPVRDGVSTGKDMERQTLVSYSDIQSLPDLTCYVTLPGPYPAVKLSLKYQTRPKVAPEFIPRDINPEMENRLSAVLAAREAEGRQMASLFEPDVPEVVSGEDVTQAEQPQQPVSPAINDKKSDAGVNVPAGGIEQELKMKPEEEMEQQLPPGISESGEVVDMAVYEAWQREQNPDIQQKMQRREEVNINVHRERGEDVEPGDDF